MHGFKQLFLTVLVRLGSVDAFEDAIKLRMQRLFE